MNDFGFKDIFNKRLIFLLIMSAILYQFGFWSTFRLNVLGYMSINDMISSFIYPFLGAFLSYVIYLFTDFFQKALISSQSLLKSKTKTPIPKIILYVLILCLLVYASFDFGPSAWIYVPFLAWFMYSSDLMELLIINKILPEDLSYVRFIQIALLLFLMSFFLGKRDSRIIHKNISFDYIKKKDSVGDDIFVYKILGNVGGYIFLETLDNSEKIISKSDKFEPIIINHFSNSKILTEKDSLIMNKIKQLK